MAERRGEHPGAAAERHIAVVDVGSNSVRLVVFEAGRRVPLPIFNEKVLCGLGRGLEASGRLDPEGAKLALESLARFAGLARAMRVEQMDLLATAAVREACNGSEFVQEVERRCGQALRVLTGEEEARLSALGVLSGMPQAAGVAGDLGGGSLELVALEGGQIGAWATLPLGPLRLLDGAAPDRERMIRLIDERLGEVTWLERLAGRSLYPVGGAWRALARIHMDQAGYPLHMVHGYVMSRKDAEDLTRLVGQLGKRTLARISGVSKRRLDTLPYAALLLNKLVERVGPDRIVFSAFGLREGWIFRGLASALKSQDPLIAATRDWAEREARFGSLGDELAAWCAPLFPQEGAAAARLRLAACHLADIGWRYHPDYRAEQMLLRVLRAQELCCEHGERAFLALVLFARYGGRLDDAEAEVPRRLLSGSEGQRAVVLGAALRLAYAASAGAPEILAATRLDLQNGELALRLPPGAPVPPGQILERRLQALADAVETRRWQLFAGEAAAVPL